VPIPEAVVTLVDDDLHWSETSDRLPLPPSRGAARLLEHIRIVPALVGRAARVPGLGLNLVLVLSFTIAVSFHGTYFQIPA
jgi:hypothetical protein